MMLWWRIVAFAFRLLYNEMAFTYDLVSRVVSLGSWRCWQRTALKHLNIESGLILELAHGTGNLQLDLHAAGYRTIGYDLSLYMGRITSKKLHGKGFQPRLIRGNAQQLPFADESFAAIISTFPTNFITAPETLYEAHRVLQPRGSFIIVLNGILVEGGAVKSVLEWLYRITGQRDNGDDSDVPAYFQGYGFQVELIEEICPHSRVQLVILRKVSKMGLDFA